MKIYKCEKCGSTDIFIECNENHHGLYCGDCGKWIKWLNKDEERLALRQIINQQSKNKNEELIRADEIRKFAEFLEKKGLLIDMKFSGDSDWDRLSSKDVIAEYEKEQNDGTR